MYVWNMDSKLQSAACIMSAVMTSALVAADVDTPGRMRLKYARVN